MSYILEALTKSEQARQQVPAAPKYSLMPVAGGEAAPHRLWPYAVAGALAVNAAVVYFGVPPVSSVDLPVIEAAKAPRSAEVPVWRELERAPRPLPMVAPVLMEKPAVEAAKPSPSEARRLQSRSEPVATERISVPPKAIDKSSVNSVVATSPVVADSPVPRKDSAVPLPSLPQELPSISVSGYIHDEGAGGMVIVNDKLLREGDEVSPGLKLEKILQDGLVFNYKGQRFKR